MANGAATRRVPTARPRIYPAGRAVLLLAVCAPELAGRRLNVAGQRVQIIRYGKLGLVVAFVDQATYADDRLERQRTDPSWLAAQARLLESAVERVRASAVVLPMRLLTVFAHSDALEGAAREQCARWSRALVRLGSKRECVVHLFGGPHVVPGGEPYLVRVSLRSARAARLPSLKAPEPVVEHAQNVWHQCAKVATAMRRVATTARGSLWSASLLIDERDVASVQSIVEHATRAGAALGVSAYLEAPRSPFTFV